MGGQVRKVLLVILLHVEVDVSMLQMQVLVAALVFVVRPSWPHIGSRFDVDVAA